MKKPQSSISDEFRWLGIFFAIFVVCVVAMLRFVAPHHFNDRVGVLICAIVAGVAMIGLRARYGPRRAP